MFYPQRLSLFSKIPYIHFPEVIALGLRDGFSSDRTQVGIQDKAQSLFPRDTLAVTHAPAQAQLTARLFWHRNEERLGHLIKRLKNINYHPEGQFSDRWRSRYTLIHNLEVKFDDSRAKPACFHGGKHNAPDTGEGSSSARHLHPAASVHLQSQQMFGRWQGGIFEDHSSKRGYSTAPQTAPSQRNQRSREW